MARRYTWPPKLPRELYICIVCGEEIWRLPSNMKKTERPFCSYECYNQARSKHGMYATSIYKVWKGAKARCHNPNHRAYKGYGGRGIFMCDAWRGEDGFENFMRDMGERPEGYTLERIYNDGPYAPWNCKWATRKENMNNRGCTVKLTLNGVTRAVEEWAEEVNITAFTIRHRLSRGWTVEDALTTPKIANQYERRRLQKNALLKKKAHA